MKVNDDGTYSIKYDDGDKEPRVKSEHVRELVEKKKVNDDGFEKEGDEETSFEVGQHVEAKFGGRKWFKGTVMKVNKDGTYSIMYDDGDKEPRVKSEHVRELIVEKKKKKDSDSEGEGNATSTFEVGQHVEVMKVNDDGTYSIKYDDGDKEPRVKSEHVRELVEKKKVNDDGFEKEGDEGTSFEVGQHAEAKFGGRKWFKGTVMKVNKDGTYSINYDDGDKEPRVKSRYVREIPS